MNIKRGKHRRDDVYELTRDEIECIIVLGQRVDRYMNDNFDFCDKDGFPIMHYDECYGEGYGDLPPIEWLLIKAGLLPKEKASDFARYLLKEPHEPLDVDTYKSIYMRYIGEENDNSCYAEGNILDDVIPLHEDDDTPLSTQEFKDFLKRLSAEKAEKKNN